MKRPTTQQLKANPVRNNYLTSYEFVEFILRYFLLGIGVCYLAQPGNLVFCIQQILPNHMINFEDLSWPFLSSSFIADENDMQFKARRSISRSNENAKLRWKKIKVNTLEVFFFIASFPVRKIIIRPRVILAF